MVVAGVIGSKNNNNIPQIINTLLSNKSIKYSIVDFHSFAENSENVFEAYLNELMRNEFDIALIYIQEDYAYYYSKLNILFDVLLFCIDDKNHKYYEENKEFFINIINHLQKDGSIIFNSDLIMIPKLFDGRAFHLITYGFNSKANITASSVGERLSEDFLMCCLQRPTFDIAKRVMEPQEYKIKRFHANASDYDMLAVVAFGIVLGIKF